MDLASNWLLMCQSAQSYSSSMSRRRRFDVAAQMISTATGRFCDQPIPQTNEELESRRLQQSALTSRIASICHADTMARMHPAVAQLIFDETKKLCDRPLGGDENARGMAHTSAVSAICHADSMGV